MPGEKWLAAEGSPLRSSPFPTFTRPLLPVLFAHLAAFSIFSRTTHRISPPPPLRVLARLAGKGKLLVPEASRKLERLLGRTIVELD